MGTAVFRDQLLSMLEESSSDNCRGEQRRMHGEYMASKSERPPTSACPSSSPP